MLSKHTSKNKPVKRFYWLKLRYKDNKFISNRVSHA